MKELSIEEKANRYDEAIERVKSKIKNDKDHVLYESDVIDIFPELYESEDEKIRKALLEMVHDTTGDDLWIDYNVHKEDVIAWLEKQGEQKPVDKVAPKFKVGDWVVYNRNDHSREVIQIYDIRDNRYYFNDNIHFSWSVKECDEKSHLWTIEDAKDGDVLATKDNYICIFDNTVEEGKYPFAYCGLSIHFEFEIYDRTLPFTHDSVYPATKEQRDLLFQKMKESGYEWNGNKKKLIKLIKL